MQAIIPLEINIGTNWVRSFTAEENNESKHVMLDLAEEKREKVVIKKVRYNTDVDKYYNMQVRYASCNIGDLVLRKNKGSRVEKEGKLSTNGEGPYRVIEAQRNESYVLETLQGSRVPHMWNISNLKKFNF